MKNKIIILIALAIIFLPTVSFSVAVPEFKLTVVVNTQNQDSSFDFSLKRRVQTCDPDTNTCSWYWQDYQNFSLQTQSLTALTTLNLIAFDDYSLSQDVAPGLKLDSILCTSDNHNDNFFYTSDSVRINPAGWSNVTCTFNNVEVQEKTPVLIVPGLTGTEIFKSSEKLWPDATRMLLSITDTFMDPLQFSEDLTPSDNSVFPDKVVSRELTFNYTDGLINEFVGQGYAEGQALFTFPYDWRYGVTGVNLDGKTNSDLLAQKIQDVMAQTGSDKVDVVAHSLGGLIIKKYVMDHQSDNYIGKAIFVGVPNIGAPKAVKVLVQGDNLDVPGLNDQEIKKISENMPAVYDLLPTQKYYNVSGSFVALVDFGDGSEEPTENDLNY